MGYSPDIKAPSFKAPKRPNPDYSRAGQTAVGAAIGGTYGGIPGAVAGGYVGNLGGTDRDPLRHITGQGEADKARDSRGRQRDLANQQYDENRGIIGGLNEADNSWLDTRGVTNTRYQNELAGLKTEATNQSKDATATYTNTIQPRLKGIMEDSHDQLYDESGNRKYMSLQEAGDPNNAVAQATRDMYDQRAQGVHKQGIADFGVLSALGGQAAAGQMGGVPMTAGAMQSIYAGQQGQAGEAFSRAQNRMFDLRQQGIDRGFERSDAQYDRGQDERDRYKGSLADISGAEADYHAGQKGFREERNGYGQGIFDLRNQGAGDKRDVVYGQGARDMAANDQRYGTLSAIEGNNAAAQDAASAGKQGALVQLLSSGVRAGATAAGAG